MGSKAVTTEAKAMGMGDEETRAAEELTGGAGVTGAAVGRAAETGKGVLALRTGRSSFSG